ncbi:MAG: response regulator, partial [Halioglobus sp.]|nr:response regulator [Halioglobus sp.]
RILMLTSAGRADQEALRSKLDISRILLKPVKHSDLLAAITDALGAATVEGGVTAPDAPREATAPRRVLLVEDNPVNQKVATDLLARRGHRVELAQNGQEAVAAVKCGGFDVVLMDVHMPVMDGLTATRTIREQEHGSDVHLPIIAMTAGATTQDREQCFTAGMDDFVTKPFRADELYRAVESVSAGGQMEAAPEAHPPAQVTPPDPQPAPQEDAAKPRDRSCAGAAPDASPATENEDQPCLDWDSALKKLEGDEALLLELSEMFLEQYEPLLAAIEEAIVSEQARELRRAAHTLKGSAQVIGGRAAAAAALVLENIGRDERLEAAGPALDELKLEVTELRGALAAVRQRAAAEGD